MSRNMMKKGAGSMAGTLMHFSPSQKSIAMNNFKHIKDKTKQKPVNMLADFLFLLLRQSSICSSLPQRLFKTLLTFKT